MNTQNPSPRRQIKPMNPFIRFKDEEIEQSIPERFEQQVRADGHRLALIAHPKPTSQEGLRFSRFFLPRYLVNIRGFF